MFSERSVQAESITAHKIRAENFVILIIFLSLQAFKIFSITLYHNFLKKSTDVV